MRYNEKTMAQKYYAGIDVGTHYVKVVVATPPQSADSPMHILATATSASKGMRHGYIVDRKEMTHAIHDTVGRAAAAAPGAIRSAPGAGGGH